MPRGGIRPGSGRPGVYQNLPTHTVRIPVALTDQVLAYAQRLDRGELPDLALAVSLLKSALPLPANKGGAIKVKIREAIALLGAED